MYKLSQYSLQRNGPKATVYLNMVTQTQTCFWKGSSRFTITEFENPHSFHNKLKTMYMNGKANRRIDFLLDCLFRVEMDNYFKYMEKDVLLPINHKVTREEECHIRGLDIPGERVKVCMYECKGVCMDAFTPRKWMRENGWSRANQGRDTR